MNPSLELSSASLPQKLPPGGGKAFAEQSREDDWERGRSRSPIGVGDRLRGNDVSRSRRGQDALVPRGAFGTFRHRTQYSFEILFEAGEDGFGELLG